MHGLAGAPLIVDLRELLITRPMELNFGLHHSTDWMTSGLEGLRAISSSFKTIN